MRFINVATSTAAIISTVFGQADSTPYCDSTTGVCYSAHVTIEQISYGVALPLTPSNDAIFQISAPLDIGWAGFAWGGAMAYNPLTVAWRNEDSVVVSSRMAFGLTYPQTFTDATYTYLEGNGVNETHWNLHVRCQGCTTYVSPADSSEVIVDAGDTAQVAYAYANTPPLDPASNTSVFDIHAGMGRWIHDVAIARSEEYENWVTSLTPPAEPEPQPKSKKLARRDVPTSCPNGGNPRFPGATADGWGSVKVLGGLTSPRGITFDTAGNLLIVENGKGITGHRLDENGCVASSSTVIQQNNLNHGIQISPDGNTLYASSATTVWSWAYNPETMTVSGNPTTLITGMLGQGHITRTLMMRPDQPNLLLVSHGSNGNFDDGTELPETGRACMKVFDISQAPPNGYNYVTDGYMMGYGLRNEVGVALDGNNMLWGIENSGDDFHRVVNGQRVDIHIDNPAEELNYLGDMTVPNDNWYGYPTCYTIGGPEVITDTQFQIGDQFVLEPTPEFNDETCIEVSRPPSAVFRAHSAPLDIKFDSTSTKLYSTFHGSWNRQPPTGFKVVEIPFETDEAGAYVPSTPLTTLDGFTEIFWNTNVQSCGFITCFRPVGIAIDAQDRLYVTSDAPAEGELFLLGRTT
ncbi:hypothetical protein AJ79_08811 [Helicocarpus griseus UAMH5409]|uniref:Uncharacterized protein n=1 Tax=Helicocarpus griseus UAMH5409 TaxID=1447875 RepID=A0A2B7WQ37_9EURO|nr:hypothetical protein AJ79_08811 [Helicocarpus griseus UAMH5409]